MDPLPVVLLKIDATHRAQEARRPAHGRRGGASTGGRRLRALGARALVALAARLDPTPPVPAPAPPPPATTPA